MILQQIYITAPVRYRHMHNMYTQQCNFLLVYMFSSGQSHIWIHIHETVGNLWLWFDANLPSFQEWVMRFESKLWLVNLILASCVPTFHSPYGPINDDVVYIFSCPNISSLWCRYFGALIHFAKLRTKHLQRRKFSLMCGSTYHHVANPWITRLSPLFYFLSRWMSWHSSVSSRGILSRLTLTHSVSYEQMLLILRSVSNTNQLLVIRSWIKWSMLIMSIPQCFIFFDFLTDSVKG